MSDSLKVSELKVSELKEELAKRKLDQKGKKAELVSRLEEALKKEKLTNASHPESTSTPEKKEKAKEEVTKSAVPVKQAAAAPASKPVTAAAIVPPSNATTPAVDTTKTPATTDATTEKGEATAEDMKKKRAERFGLPPTDEDKKKSRAERFGIPATVTTSASHVASPAKLSAVIGDTKQLERAKRFGIPIKGGDQSQKTESAASATKLQERAQRFRVAGGPAVKASIHSGNQTWTPADEEKKRKRMERFATAAPNGDTKKQKVV